MAPFCFNPCFKAFSKHFGAPLDPHLHLWGVGHMRELLEELPEALSYRTHYGSLLGQRKMKGPKNGLETSTLKWFISDAHLHCPAWVSCPLE